ncbi:AraC family transcriptional regulator [Paenibacillus polymyxa]|nr:AraC family ligand binding domain-containing protein [Paenibacillus polymyxa]
MFMESKERKEVFFTESLLKELYLINIGYEKCLPCHSFGPQIREYYVLHYILSGQGKFSRKQTTYYLKPGNFFLIEPNDLYAIYEADEQNPWEYVWIGFQGSKVNEILTKLGFGTHTRVGSVQNRAEAEQYIQSLISNDLLRQDHMLRIQGNFFHMLSYFQMDAATDYAQRASGSSKQYVDLFVMHVRNSYWNPELTVTSIAEQIGLHPTYLTHLVKMELRQTSLEYLTHYRILRGKFLLENTDFTIDAIAQTVGYQNPLSFARAFKRIFGVSPRLYGKKHS